MTYCSVVAVLALVGLTKKRFAILKNLSLRSPSKTRSLTEGGITVQGTCPYILFMVIGLCI